MAMLWKTKIKKVGSDVDKLIKYKKEEILHISFYEIIFIRIVFFFKMFFFLILYFHIVLIFYWIILLP
jgi:hypothetical protein